MDLVGGWALPLWKIWVRQAGWLFAIYGKIFIKCSKPPTSHLQKESHSDQKQCVRGIFCCFCCNDSSFGKKIALGRWLGKTIVLIIYLLFFRGSFKPIGWFSGDVPNSQIPISMGRWLVYHVSSLTVTHGLNQPLYKSTNQWEWLGHLHWPHGGYGNMVLPLCPGEPGELPG